MSNNEEVKETCAACSQEFKSIDVIEWSGLTVCEVCASEAEQ